MRRVDIIRRAGRNLRQAKGRTLLTSLAIAVGAFTLTLALAAGQGMRDYTHKLLQTNIDPQAIFVVKDKSLFGQGGEVGLREYDPDVSLSNSGRPGATLKMMTDKDVEYLNARGDLTQIVPVYQLSPKWVQFEKRDQKYIGSVDYYDATVLSETSAGNLPALGKQIADDEVVVPEKYAESLKISPQSLIGQLVTLTFTQQTTTATQDQIQAAFIEGGTAAVEQLLKPIQKEFSYKVVAVSKANAMSFGSSPRLLISANSAKAVNDFATAGSSSAGKYMGVSALAKQGVIPESVKKDLEANQYYSQTAKDAQGLLFTIVNTLQGIVVGFGLLALFASVFGIINTQYISVLERTSQIGLMKALGMPRRGIAKLFRYEAAWIGFLGGAIGSSLAVVLGTWANPSITKLIEIGEGNQVLVFVWWHILALVVTLMLIAIVAGWFPARKAARLDPIEALRTE
ncbi:MAG: ABC transporter permease [Candidatus Saccharimonas sp.]|nr:ABC transporter permease [Candidatus Saccharimonas sp.]